MSSELFVHEQRVVKVLIFSFFVFACFIYFEWSESDHSLSTPLQKEASQFFEVDIQGAVEHPGVYRVKEKSLLKIAIKKSKPLAIADLQRVMMNRRVLKNLTIIIPKLEMHWIEVFGAVENPGKILVPKNMRLCDLVNYIECRDSADLSCLESIKKVRKNQKIEVLEKRSLAE